jgi:tetratricopeptide (TPR) repeat protein
MNEKGVSIVKKWMTALVLLVLAGPVVAGEMDKAKLRQLAKLSKLDGFVLGLSFSASKGFLFAGEKIDPPLEKIARIRKEMTGDASDAERYFRIAVLYEKAGRKEDADDAGARAIAQFRQQVKEHPDDMRRLAQLGDALFCNGQTKEGEALLRRAVKEAPNDWRVWGIMGKCLDNKASLAILGRQDYHFDFPWEEVMHPALLEMKPKAEQIAEWRRLQKEALRCFDRAIESAPRETEPHYWRLGSLYIHGLIEAGLANVQGEQVPIWNAFLKPAGTEETRQIARLSPNDPRSVGGAVVVELLICMAKAQTKDKEPTSSFAEPLPEPSLDFVRWGTHRLEELTKSADKNTAAAASEILAYALMARIAADGVAIEARMDSSEESEAKSSSTEKTQPKLKEALGFLTTGLKMMAYLGQIEGNLRRAIKLDPTRELPWDMLTVLLHASGRTAEAVALSEQRIKVKDNAHNRFVLAYGYAEQRKCDKAIEQLRAEIKCDENNLSCRLGLVAALLQRGDGDDLKQAGEQLDALASPIKVAKKKNAERNTTCYAVCTLP